MNSCAEVIKSVKNAFVNFENAVNELQNAAGAVDSITVSYREAAEAYKANYLQEIEKAVDIRMRLYKDRDLMHKQLRRLQADWSAAAMEDLNERASEIDNEIERVNMEIRKQEIKIKAIEEMKIEADPSCWQEAKALHEKSLKAWEGFQTANGAAKEAARNLEKAVQTVNLRFYPAESVPVALKIEKLETLKANKTVQEYTAQKQAEEQKREEMDKTLRDQATRFAELERQIRVTAREKELINSRTGKTVTVDGKEFAAVQPYPHENYFEYKAADGQQLRDYLDQTMPLTEADYRNGGFKPDGSKYAEA